MQILHVSGLMESVTREQLRELFSQAGEVTKVDIPDGGRSMVSAGGLPLSAPYSLFVSLHGTKFKRFRALLAHQDCWQA